MLLFLLRTPPSANDLDDSIIGLIFILPWILAIGFYFFKRATVTKWEQGIFPISLEYNRDNLLEAYICLAARMIQSDPREAGEKVLYMNRYFKQHFPNAHYDFGESLSFSYRNPIQINTVSKWLMLKLPLRKQRLQIMYFLAGISFVDGALNRKELGILKELSDLLGLSPKEFDSIISMYTRRERNSSQQSTTKSKDYYIKLACRVLGVSEHASMEEIKKAYRSLVKKHHPDLFADQSTEQQEIAEQRFLEIQKAYELLEKYK